jgi:RNase adapter protein RapZ
MAEFLIVAGMSGAGRSTVAASLEDLQWVVIDNLPASVMARMGELVGEDQQVALIVGRGGGANVPELLEAIHQLRSGPHNIQTLFLDAPDDVLIRRYEGTRRRHPIADQNVEAAVQAERRGLEDLKDTADVLLDTGDLNVNQLRARIFELYGEARRRQGMRITMMSFGFKYGIPLDVDMVFDVRFLPNPHWDDTLRPLNGRDEAVASYVLGQSEAQDFLAQVENLLTTLIPGFEREGKTYLTIAVGCTGGQHRSVAITEALSAAVRESGQHVATFHRDVDR